MVNMFSLAGAHAGVALHSASALFADKLHNSPDTNLGKQIPAFQTLIGYGSWIVGAIAIATLILNGAKLTVAVRHGGNEELGRFGAWLAGALVFGAGSWIVSSTTGVTIFNTKPQAIPGLTAVQDWINRITFGGIFVGMIGLFIAAGTMMVHARRGEGIGLGLVKVLAGLIIVTGASGLFYVIVPGQA